MRRRNRRSLKFPAGRPSSPLAFALALALAITFAGCGGGGKEPAAPTRPDPIPEVAFVPTAPAPQPTPTPVPGSEPEEDPLPAIPGGGVSGSCGDPLPPPISRMNVKLHGRSGDRYVLDSTPLVGPDAAYCKRIGFTDGRTICPVRVEGDPERIPCETLRVGRASDSGRPGPTWTANGKRCDGPDGGTACMNHPANQYLVFAYGSGTFRACTQGGVCGQIVL